MDPQPPSDPTRRLPEPDWADSYYAGRREPEHRRVITVTPAAKAQIRGIAAGMNNWYVRVRIEVFRDGR